MRLTGNLVGEARKSSVIMVGKMCATATYMEDQVKNERII
jgi:hypothetical protein